MRNQPLSAILKYAEERLKKLIEENKSNHGNNYNGDKLRDEYYLCKVVGYLRALKSMTKSLFLKMAAHLRLEDENMSNNEIKFTLQDVEGNYIRLTEEEAGLFDYIKGESTIEGYFNLINNDEPFDFEFKNKDKKE